MDRFLAMFATTALVAVLIAPLLGLLLRKRARSVLPRDFDFTHYKRTEPK